MLDSDIKMFHSSEVSENATNGGRRSYNEVVSGVVNNVWPHVTKAQRTAGQTLYRFLYVLADDDDDGTLISASEYIDYPTDGEDYIVMFEMSYESTQADITGSERKYAVAYIANDITAATGPVTFDVTVSDASLASGTDAVFQVGDTIRLTDMTSPDSSTGNEEFLTITTVSNVDALVTITVSEDIANSYTTASGARVSSLLDIGDVETSTGTYVITTAGDGDYDYSSYPIVLDNMGTETDVLTFDFTSATAFTCTGSSGTNYGSGTTSADFTPTNANNTKPYFTLESAGFSGTWAGGDTLVIPVFEASFLVCLKRIVPAGCASLANNMVRSCTLGESDS